MLMLCRMQTNIRRMYCFPIGYWLILFGSTYCVLHTFSTYKLDNGWLFFPCAVLVALHLKGHAIFFFCKGGYYMQFRTRLLVYFSIFSFIIPKYKFLFCCRALKNCECHIYKINLDICVSGVPGEHSYRNIR